MHPLSSKKADEVTTAIIVELWPFVGKIRSLTMDNGKEFSGHETFAAILQTKVYFAHPYASWERGTNENANGLIRQYLPKGMSFNNLDMALCKEIEQKLNMSSQKAELYRFVDGLHRATAAAQEPTPFRALTHNHNTKN